MAFLGRFHHLPVYEVPLMTTTRPFNGQLAGSVTCPAEYGDDELHLVSPHAPSLALLVVIFSPPGPFNYFSVIAPILLPLRAKVSLLEHLLP